MEPTTNYYKTKRTFLLFIGALLLAIFAGFKITNSERISVLPFQLQHPELLTHILFVAVVFYLFEFSLQWAAQISEVQRNIFHKIDFIAVITVSVVSILCYVGWLARPYFKNLTINSVSDALKLAAAVVAAISASGLASTFFARIASRVGRLLKSKDVSEDDKLIRLLKSQIWILNYNPKQRGKEKEISFKDDGSVGTGANDNESKWRVKNGLLEIINSDGRVFSRFLYDDSKQLFLHTNDPDTLSIKSQTIRPK